MGERSLAEWLGAAQPADVGDEPAGAGEADGPVERGEADGPAQRGEEPWDRPAGGRTRRLLLLAAVPWVAVVVLAVALAPGPPAVEQHDVAYGPDGSPEAHGEAAPADGEAAAPEDEAPSPAGALLAGGAEDTAAAADAVALAAVHLSVTGSEAGTERYVELAAVERREARPGNVVVVTVLAVVLDGEDGTWTGRRPARFAVPVGTAEGTPRLLGPPWALPAPDAEPGERPAGEPDDTAAEAARRALADASYDGVEVDSVERIGDDLLRVTADAVAPGESARRAVEVWVGEDPEPSVLGLVPHPSPDADEEEP